MEGFVWWLGWRFKVAAIGAVILFVFGAGVHPAFGMVLAAGCLGLWFWGVTVINSNHEKILDTAVAQFMRDGVGNPEQFANVAPIVISTAWGTEPFIKCCADYWFVILYPGEGALRVYDRPRFDLKNKRPYRGDSTREVYYEHISNVDFVNGALVVALSSGGGLRYPGHGADAAVSLLRAKLHSLREARNARQHSLHAMPAAMPAVVHREREVIERQVVVMRCRFCNQLTPAELTQCKSCGVVMGGA
ncbi:hypothetical protein [Polyangium sorediatum]|uniref:Zinc ribbon domain-containing protein n=1 Tax=Polyangium sorediatum TaxID=889274 RepID=A0ABT6NT27_9BACT|nr:hypothetical protein [Polyangium sorediatum]MDI1431501.1 hypothetical protein [Polyangium sorediatum]